jgi:hypothetical protein
MSPSANIRGEVIGRVIPGRRGNTSFTNAAVDNILYEFALS